ncbi:hypothetical protein DFS34DRAFT_670392 [Phlyctochytrium arcticum]|nr:hypothetical protein DFS34DRAFT_670392 [Phlyctochytrium arcticum]
MKDKPKKPKRFWPTPGSFCRVTVDISSEVATEAHSLESRLVVLTLQQYLLDSPQRSRKEVHKGRVLNLLDLTPGLQSSTGGTTIRMAPTGELRVNIFDMAQNANRYARTLHLNVHRPSDDYAWIIQLMRDDEQLVSELKLSNCASCILEEHITYFEPLYVGVMLAPDEPLFQRLAVQIIKLVTEISDSPEELEEFVSECEKTKRFLLDVEPKN